MALVDRDNQTSAEGSPELFEKRRRRRSIAIALALAAMAAMFFTATIVQLKDKVASDRFKAVKERNVKQVD